MYEAEKFVQLHVQNEHTSMFDYLLNLDKKYTGLTDLQKKMVQFFHMGLNDKEIVKRWMAEVLQLSAIIGLHFERK